MQKSIDVGELPGRLDAVLRDVAREHASYVLAQDGQPEAAIIPYDDFQRLSTSRADTLLTRLDRLEERLAALDGGSPEFAAELPAAVSDGVPFVDAQLAAQRVLNSRLNWGSRSSTDVLREIREG